MIKRQVLRIALAIALVVFGFFYLLRSCLSQYDERAAIGGSSSSSASQFLVFEKDGKGIIFSLVKFDKTVSYSRNGGVINKSVSTTYYAQANDLATAAKTALQKIKNHREVKNFPVEILGAAGNQAWIFVGELMAYDPFTLTKTADAKIVEAKNPALKGKLINERRYYDFDNETKQIIITAADGAKFSLNTTTLIAAAIDEDNTGVDAADKRIKELDLLTRQTREQRENKNLGDEIKRTKENTRRTGSGFSGMKVNCDTIGGTWYGLYTNEEIQKTGDRFRYESNNDETARNKLFTAALGLKDKYRTIGDEKKKTSDAVFLQGGFLLNKETGIPFHLPEGFLLVHKDIIGREGKVQLTRIRFNGEQVWTLSTGLKEFFDWQPEGNRLVVTGTDNKNLSSGEVNVLLVIDLQNGNVVGYDFFSDKVREAK